ncbi:MAG: MBL fold metallo-hydrolase [Desulfobacteraceae bacterium 4572_130]|nr:MAG: MBL fold metallo-hydrolase [Desulfobacteraceae bacterium 4572_130]
MKITILCENYVGLPLGVIGEHGFACYIETRQGNYLFDTGQGFGIVQNSLILKKDLSKIDGIIISHGHYDHTGGLDKVLSISGKKNIYAHPDIFIKRFWGEKFIGIPFNQTYLESLGADFKFNKDLVEIEKELYLTGEIPRLNEFEKGDLNMYAIDKNKNIIKPDPIQDDLSLLIDSPKGLIIILGCAHAGMINIINYAIKKLNKDKIYAIIGGTHLGFSSDAQFKETLNVIDEYKIELVGVSHCTGLPKASLLHSKLKDKFFFGSIGTTLEI